MNFKGIFLLLVLLCLIITEFSNAQGLNFFSGSFDEALAEANKENKILMIDFYTDWCVWCKELDKKVYTNFEVAEFANKNFINLKIDAEKGSGVELAKSYKIVGYPAILFLNEKKEEIDRIYGYLSPKEFFNRIQDIAGGINTLDSIKKALVETPDSPALNYKLAKKYIDNGGEAEDILSYLEKVITNDPANISGYKDDALLLIAVASGNLNNIRKFIEDNPESDVLKNALVYLAEKLYQETNNYEEARKYYDSAFEKFGKDDRDIRNSYGEMLLTQISGVIKNNQVTKNQKKEYLGIADEAIEVLKGTDLYGYAYYYKAKLLYTIENFKEALENINSALQVNDTNEKFLKLKTDIEEKLK
ncbi:MAG: thioredoxin family protein [Ignavibacteria bacterium]